MSALSDVPRYPKPEAVLRVPEYGHAIIEASAGTGKTHTIEHLVVDLLVCRGARIDEILVVTFTERAALELRQRIRAKLEELLALESTTTDSSPENCWILNAKARERLEAALVELDTVSIATIHGFCHRVLTENAFSNGRLFEQQLVNERKAFGRAFKDMFLTELSRRVELLPYLAAWLESRPLGVDALEELLYRAYSTRATIGPRLDPEGLEDVLQGLPDIRIRRQDLIASGVDGRSHDKILRNLEALIDALDTYRRSRDLASLLAELEDVELGYLRSKLLDFEAARTGLERLFDRSMSLSAAVVDRFLPLVEERLWRMKRERGWFDDTDLLSIVERALDGPRGAELARKLQSRYRSVLIDEFQDTDETQWSIFRSLFFDVGARTPLWLVGDPKQAIYGFRGADVHVYLEARSHLVARSAMVPLVENFRSTPELIEGLNHVFDQRAEPAFFTGNIRYDRPVRAGRPELGLIGEDGAPRAPVVLLQSEDKKTLLSQIAVEIEALSNNPSKKLFFGPEGTERPLEARDIFVLTRTAKESDEILEALVARGVPSSFYEREGLFQSREAEDVKILLDAIWSPHDPRKRVRAWMTGFFGLSLADVEGSGDVPSSHPLNRYLVEWKTLAEANDCQSLFSSILERSGVIRRALFSGTVGKSAVNTEHLFDVLLEEVHRTGASFPELVRILEGYIEGRGLAPDHERNVMRLENDRAVRVMTIPRAKGLEAPIVFVYGFSRGRPEAVHTYHEGGERKAYVGNLAEAPSSVRGAVERERLEEEQRLLYVALTRAKCRLYLPLLPEKAPGIGAYAQLNRRLQGLVGVFESVIAERSDVSRPEASGRHRSREWEPPPELLEPPDETGTPFDALRGRSRALVLTSESRTKSIRSGIFVQEVFEKLDFRTLQESSELVAWRERADVRELFRRQMRRNGVDPRFRPDAERLVHTALTTPVKLGEHRLLKGFGAVERELRAVKFVYPYPENDGVLRHGFIKGFADFVFEIDGATFLCDWKSEVLSSWDRAAVSDHVRRNYVLQEKLSTLGVIEMLGLRTEEDYRERFGGIVYCFVRGMPQGGIYFDRPSWTTVASWREELVRETE